VNVNFRLAQIRDAKAIVPRLRERDLEGLQSVGDPTDIITGAMQCSIASFTALADGEVAVMWGVRVCALLSDEGYLWMLGTRVVDEHPVHFLRYSKSAVKIMRERYALLYGEVASDYERSIRWLTWLGGKVRAGPMAERLVFSL
jgi:hypothetical protein